MSLELFKGFAKGHEQKIIENKAVFVYTRVSSKNQQDTNGSLENQICNSKEFAQKKGFVVSHTFGCTYESASGDFTRKEFSKLIETVRGAKKRPYAILINTINRFSRTGANGITLANELVEKLGVHLIEVATGRSTETEDGKLQIYQGLLYAKQENLDRLKITVPGMVRFLENGYWLGNTPRGFDHFGPRVKGGKYSEQQRITVNEEGKLLKQAWQWKLQGERDFIILDKLKDLGLKNLSKQFLSLMWRNPFFCGISVHKMLGGKVIRGKWEKMVSEDDFLMVQQILEGNNFGYKQDRSNPERPLNAFIRCAECGEKLCGYEVKTKKVHYYKCQSCEGVSINANTTKRARGEGAHDLFVILLEKYTLQEPLKELFKAQLRLTYDTLNHEKANEAEQLKKEREKLTTKLAIVNEKLLFDLDIDRAFCKTTKLGLETQLASLDEQIQKLTPKLSNLEKYIEVSTDVVSNISKYWVSGDLDTKKRVQELLFSDGLSLDVKQRAYLTSSVNSVFAVSADLAMVSEDIKEKRQPIFQLPSSSVAGVRLELTTFGL